jgi:hypothetical protein
VGRETQEEAGKVQEGGGSEYIGWHGEVELQVAVDGSDRVQQSASGKYGMKVGNVLESRGSIEGQ